MLLIQAGGVGILTLASYFSYFFKGGPSYKDQLAMGKIFNIDRFDNPNTILERNNILVVHGENKDIWQFIDSNN